MCIRLFQSSPPHLAAGHLLCAGLKRSFGGIISGEEMDKNKHISIMSGTGQCWAK